MKRPVAVMGSVDPLHVVSLGCSCGDVEYSGVAFEFADRGPWVIDLAELKAIVAEAEAHQASVDHLKWQRRNDRERRTAANQAVQREAKAKVLP